MFKVEKKCIEIEWKPTKLKKIRFFILYKNIIAIGLQKMNVHTCIL